MLGPPKLRCLDRPISRSIEELVPVDHFYRYLDATLDLTFVRIWVHDRYAEQGRPSIDPVVFFCLQFIMFFEGIRSERQLMQTVVLNLAHRWYLGYDVDEPLPDHSSLTRIRERLGLPIFQRFFEHVVELCQAAGRSSQPISQNVIPPCETIAEGIGCSTGACSRLLNSGCGSRGRIMAKVTGLGHVGVYVNDMPRMVDFYTSVLGLQVTDRGEDDRIVFLSARPHEEHHEVALARSPDLKTNAQQISFTVGSLQDLKALYRRIKAEGRPIERVVNHGIAFGCYFRDPEDNRVEVYWSTGKDYPQPHGDPIDLEADDADLLHILATMPPKERAAQPVS